MSDERTFTADEQALLDLHRDWYYSNFNVNIPLMRTVFPSGEDTYIMYNLNGFPYFGVDELDTLWRFYARTSNFGLATDRVMRVEVNGDLGYVLSEGIFPVEVLRDDDRNDLPEPQKIVRTFRSTEIYKRDDGTGNPEWKMWHFHCSETPDDSETPISKTPADSTANRGRGNTPYSKAIELDYSVYEK
jgi:hypothetical protein